MPTKLDLTFETFGRLWALNPVAPDAIGNIRWLCLCECGNQVLVPTRHLRSGNSSSRVRSCGCYQKDMGKVAAKAKRTHGHSENKRSPTYKSWCKMRSRCANPNADQWPYYGGRGIKVDPRWDSFENFLADMGERPDGLSIDRIDNEGDYEPDNCKWSTQNEQMANRRCS